MRSIPGAVTAISVESRGWTSRCAMRAGEGMFIAADEKMSKAHDTRPPVPFAHSTNVTLTPSGVTPPPTRRNLESGVKVRIVTGTPPRFKSASTRRRRRGVGASGGTLHSGIPAFELRAVSSADRGHSKMDTDGSPHAFTSATAMARRDGASAKALIAATSGGSESTACVRDSRSRRTSDREPAQKRSSESVSQSAAGVTTGRYPTSADSTRGARPTGTPSASTPPPPPEVA
jgi:hypothetical protein